MDAFVLRAPGGESQMEFFEAYELMRNGVERSGVRRELWLDTSERSALQAG